MAKEPGQRASIRKRTAPEPDDPRKPDEITEITKPSWTYILRKTVREFMADHAFDLAAALTYFGVLAVFPALLAFVSIVGLLGDPEETTDALLELLRGLVPGSTLDAISGPIEDLARSPSAGFGFVVGIGGALWSASGYVRAFSRAMNRIYSIQEGRPFWKLHPITLAVTVLAIVVAVIAALLVTISGPIAERVGRVLGLADAALAAWDILKWPVLGFLAVLLVAVLYYATPNVRQPRFRWISAGAILALVVWVLASAGFAFYAANFANYDRTYGAIGGIIVFLLWVWISNIALLLGAELDAELERGRELQAGIAAEAVIQLPPRDTRQSDKAARKHQKDLERGRRLRGAPVEVDGDSDEQREPDPEALKKASKWLRRTNMLQRAQFIAPKGKKK